jgi:hypothetical protein
MNKIAGNANSGKKIWKYGKKKHPVRGVRATHIRSQTLTMRGRFHATYSLISGFTAIPRINSHRLANSITSKLESHDETHINIRSITTRTLELVPGKIGG